MALPKLHAIAAVRAMIAAIGVAELFAAVLKRQDSSAPPARTIGVTLPYPRR